MRKPPNQALHRRPGPHSCFARHHAIAAAPAGRGNARSMEALMPYVASLSYRPADAQRRPVDALN